MIKDHQREFDRLQILLDGIVIAFSYGVAWLLMINGFVPTKGDPLRAEFYLMALLIVIAFICSISSVCPKAGAGKASGICQYL